MSQRIPCPQCHRQLLLPADCTAAVLSCPSCRTEIDNPQATPPSPSAPEVTAPPTAEFPVTTSPTPRMPGLQLDEGDPDAPHENYGMSRGSVFLASLGGLGIAYGLLVGVAMLKDRESRPLLIFLSLLVLFTLFSAARASNRHPRDSMGSFVGRTILGLLTITGVGVGVGLLLALAAVIILFAVCLSKGAKC